MIYLSDFNTSRRDDRAISIARTARGWKGASRKDLAPAQTSLTAFHKKQITTAQFVFEYMEKIYTTIDFEEEAERLDGKILLCHCDKQVFCHRALFGMFLKAETGIEVEEIGGYGDWFLRILDEIKNGQGYPVDFILDRDTVRFFDLEDMVKDAPEDGLIGHWKELNDRGLLFLYQDEYSPNEYPEEYYQKHVERFLKENNLTEKELYKLGDISQKMDIDVVELLALAKEKNMPVHDLIIQGGLALFS